MPRGKKRRTVEDRELTKGQLRKLEALRKSLGADIADRAFAEWLASQPTNGSGAADDRNASLIADELMRLIEREGVQIPRGGYRVRRGRGRVIVERGAE